MRSYLLRNVDRITNEDNWPAWVRLAVSILAVACIGIVFIILLRVTP